MQVAIPRCRLSTASTLNGPLKEMGRADAFTAGRAAVDGVLPADFVAREEPYVSDAVQKAFVEVNEEGTEAAAGTMVQV